MQWVAYTARIRRGELPTCADVLSIERLIATVSDGRHAAFKRLDEATEGALKMYHYAIGATAEWRTFLRILKEVEHCASVRRSTSAGRSRGESSRAG